MNMKYLASLFITLFMTGFFASTHMVAAEDYRLVKITDELDMPWGLAFLPNGDLLVTELSGSLRRVRDGKVSAPIGNVPDVLYDGQGGLMDVVLHPDFAENNLVYLTYAAGTPEANRLVLMRARLADKTLENPETLYQTQNRNRPVHFGARLVFLNDGTLILTHGDAFDEREKAQDLSSSTGKILRLTETGDAPPDNPFIGQSGSRPEIFSYGHRNPQAVVYDPQTDRIYAHEHGPRGGDELNLIRPRVNYGWPAITYGIDYSGAKISPYTALPGMEQPLTYWDPSIAPSGMTLYQGAMFPEWQGDLFMTSLRFKNVYHVDMQDGLPAQQKTLFGEINQRLRDIRTAPDGSLYILAEGNKGAIWQVLRK
ncbi:hypothetical protein IMCC14465_15220 [alpha proteobacterium IMCC14465]|uniref:Glucose/Sorbosone dehydrogenase domain-containing protein n=1 Tax=alpha proteobacterium IMCC14465 TaxID=1220535 RepID=J9A2U4_9PROT|nr:hypothetical protein IMCC14465_15220 [alpha proteobacterium IMCC14465]